MIDNPHDVYADYEEPLEISEAAEPKKDNSHLIVGIGLIIVLMIGVSITYL